MSELDEQLNVYIEEWRKQKHKEEDELKNLKERQIKRRVSFGEHLSKTLKKVEVERCKIVFLRNSNAGSSYTARNRFERTKEEGRVGATEGR